jgi:putative SOS response-associated peptidase YedK
VRTVYPALHLGRDPQFLSVIGAPKNLRPRYNIAPMTMIDVVRLTDAGRELVSMRWGLVPFFWRA